VSTQQRPKVAILLATYNGAPFVDAQIRSLKRNATPFELHWLDDHSSDNTREAVRAVAASLDIEVTEWHQPQHLGVPGAFFQLMECVEADIYLFCDQDDIWQPGKIDATVASLLPELRSPALSFSDPLCFTDGQPEKLRRLSDVFENARAPRSLQESRLFMSACCCGNTAGFTRPLREIFLRHKDVAHRHAAMHDSWMYVIATAAGSARMLNNVPTTLFRRHGRNFTEFFLDPKENWFLRTWRLQQVFRRYIARQAEGFVLAYETLPPGPKRERLLALAKLVANLTERQSPTALLRLIRSGAMWPSRRSTLWFTASCLWCTVGP
jgi:glycosyltransferase involved in cell wall biosynthesis